MDLKALTENIQKCADLQAKMDAFGVPLEQVDPRHLNISDENFNEHVRVQPIAISFFGVCVKQASAEVDHIKFEYDIWRQKKYISTKAALGKATKDDIEAHLKADNEGELREWQEKLKEAENQHSMIDATYKSWLQKGFTLREHAKLRGDEWNTSGSIMEPSNNRNSNKLSLGNGAIPAPYNMNAAVARVRQQFAADKTKENKNPASENIGS